MGFLSRFRKKQTKPEGMTDERNGVFVVDCDGERVWVRAPMTQEASLSWSDLEGVAIRTNELPAPGEPVWWFLGHANGVLPFPNCATGVQKVFEVMQARLPTFNSKRLIEAEACSERRTFILWDRHGRHRMEAGYSSPAGGMSGRGKISRFAPISENAHMLLPEQIAYMKTHLGSVGTAILALQDPRVDEMLPEYASFIPNLMAEFNENPKLAMIHGRGAAHAWIDVKKLREIFASQANQITDYRSLFRAFTDRGYEVRKIKYITFRSALNSDED
jgi:hypothetical protein